MGHIAIIGAGNIGRALQHVLRPKKLKIELWDKQPGKVARQRPLARIVAPADAVFLCVPSFAVPEAAGECRPYLNRKCVVVSIAKGIDANSGETVDQVLKRSLPPGQPFALLSGPMLATELMKDAGGAAMAGSSSLAARKRVVSLFHDTSLWVAASDDVRGVALAGVLKNVYAIVAGAAEAMGFGYNAKGLLVAGSIEEMERILPRLGGKRATAFTLAGLGDLIATGMSHDSRNHSVGMTLVKGGRGPRTSEGSVSLPFIWKRLGRAAASFPILSIAHEILKDPRHGKKALQAFIAGK